MVLFDFCFSNYCPVSVLLKGDFRTSRVWFSVLRRTMAGFLEVGIWNRFMPFWVNPIGLSTSLLADLQQPGVLEFPQGIHRFLPSAVK